MNPLKTNQLILTWFGASPSHESLSKWIRIARCMFTLSVIIANFLSVFAGVLFILKFISINLEEAIFALFHTIAYSNMLYQSVMIVVLRRKLTTIFEHLSKIYDKSKESMLI